MSNELANISLFEGLGKEALEAIDRITSTRQYPKNSVIIHEGDLSNSMFLLIQGKVKVYLSDQEGKEFILNSLEPGDYFGELSLLDDERRTASVMTSEQSTFKVLLKNDFDQLRQDFPMINEVLIGNLVGTIRHLTDSAKSLALKDVYGRIRNLLSSLANADAGTISEKLTQQEIANRVGSSREMVARILKDLATGGYIQIEKKFITILKDLPEHY